MKKIIALLLTAVMLCTMLPVFADDILIAPKPDADGASVTLRVEGISKNLLYTTCSIKAGDNVLAVLSAALNTAAIDCTVSDSSYGGKFVSAIGGEAAGKFGAYDGWMYYVDGVEAQDTMDVHTLKGGESILVCYSDAYGTPATLMPEAVASRNEDGTVTLTVSASSTTYDEKWNPTTTVVPVEKVNVTVDGTVYVSDKDGKVTLSETDSAKETISVQLEKTAENGKPLVIRLAPDYKLSLKDVVVKPISFSDVNDSDWFAPYVQQLAALKAIGGYQDGSFRPQNAITRAEVVKILAQASGDASHEKAAAFSDVAADAWYYDAVCWAAEQGVVTGFDGKFQPSAPVTRQDLAVMLVRYAEKVLKKTLPADQQAPAFTDNAAIAAYASEAIYQLQKAGIVSGQNNLFRPADTAARSELCKMVSLLLKVA